MLKGKTITLAIPCKNEEIAIATLLKKVPKYVDEVIVIDNNSSDKTAPVARKLGAKVFVEKRHVDGIGYGFAHQKAIKETTTDYLVTMDGDNTYPLDAIKLAVTEAEKKHLNFISCNRFPLKNEKVLSPIRRLGVWILNFEVRILYGYKMNDILSGMWLMDRTARKKLKLSEGGWNLSPEIKLAALTHPQVAFGEYHVHHHVRAGESKQLIWKTGFEHLAYILIRRIWTDSKLKTLFSTKIEFATQSLSFEN